MAIRKIVSRSIGTDVIAAEDLAANSVTVAEIQNGAVTLDKLSATGTKDATTFLRGDNSFQVVDVNDVTGDFTVDTDVLVVDSTNDRVGINKATPSHPLHIEATAAGQTAMKVESNQAGAMNVAFDVDTDRDLLLQMQEAGSTRWDFLMNGSSGTNALKFRNENGSTVMDIPQSGYITKPYTPSFQVNGDPSKDGSNIVYNFSQVTSGQAFNNGSHYNNSNGRFTAPVDGKYFFTAGIWAQAGQNSYLTILKNGNEHVGGHIDADNQASSGYVSGVVSMAANDYVQIRALYSIQGSTPRNYFGGFLIG
jgi:hypothetical protein